MMKQRFKKEKKNPTQVAALESIVVQLKNGVVGPLERYGVSTRSSRQPMSLESIIN